MKKTWIIAALSALCMAPLTPSLLAHCQIPCGIYDDDARFTSIEEHLKTIEKSMRQIRELSKRSSENVNQLVRWVNNKETHANAISEIVTAYFLTQKIKPDTGGDSQATKKYLHLLKYCHEMLHFAMKCKQTTDVANVDELGKAKKKFHGIYHP